MAKVFTIPKIMQECNPHGCCAGCGHGIATRIIYEVIEELGLERTAIAFHDLACGSNMVFAQRGNAFSGAHGRAIPTATGYKRLRPESLVFTYAGDGATYNIGMQHTVHTALRDENITAIVVNNTTFGMTGGQMSATSTLGQKTTSSPAGRDKKKNGNPVSIEKLYGGMDIAYLARGSVDSVANIAKTKSMIKKAFQKQLAGEGFSYIEILAPCPTNWGMTALQAQERIRTELLDVYPIGEFIDRA